MSFNAPAFAKSGDNKIIQSEVARDCAIENYLMQISTIFASQSLSKTIRTLVAKMISKFEDKGM